MIVFVLEQLVSEVKDVIDSSCKKTGYGRLTEGGCFAFATTHTPDLTILKLRFKDNGWKF